MRQIDSFKNDVVCGKCDIKGNVIGLSITLANHIACSNGLLHVKINLVPRGRVLRSARMALASTGHMTLKISRYFTMYLFNAFVYGNNKTPAQACAWTTLITLLKCVYWSNNWRCLRESDKPNNSKMLLHTFIFYVDNVVYYTFHHLLVYNYFRQMQSKIV